MKFCCFPSTFDKGCERRAVLIPIIYCIKLEQVNKSEKMAFVYLLKYFPDDKSGLLSVFLR